MGGDWKGVSFLDMYAPRDVASAWVTERGEELDYASWAFLGGDVSACVLSAKDNCFAYVLCKIRK